MKHPWKYFDDLRSLAALKRNGNLSKLTKTSTGTKLESIQTKEGSSVVEVTVLEGERRRTYRLCTLSSFIPLSWGGRPLQHFYGQAKGVLMAANDFNYGFESVVSNLPTSSANFLDNKECNIRFVADFYDTEFAPLAASRKMSEHLFSDQKKYETTAVVGAFLSTVSYPLSVLTSLFGIPQISHVSASTELDNRKLFGRVVATTEGVANALVDFFLKITGGTITHFAFIHFYDEYGTDLRQSIVDVASLHRIRVKVFSVIYDKSKASLVIEGERIRQVVEEFSKSGLKYVFCATHDTHMKTFLKEAVHLKAAGPGFLWVFGESVKPSTFRSVKLNPETDGDLAVAFQGVGHLHTNYFDEKNSRFQQFSREWRDCDENEEFGQYFQSKQPQSNIVKFTANQTFSGTVLKYPALLYDAVMALGIAACGIEETFFDGEKLFDAFKKTKFDGVTGRVEMNTQTGTRDYRTLGYTMSNIVLGPKDKEGNITLNNIVAYKRSGLVKDDAPKWIEVGSTKFNYSDSSFDPPDPLPPLKEDENMIGAPLKIIGISLGTLVMILSLFFAWWTYHNRRSRVVRASQPLFLILICFGTFIMGISFFPLSFEETEVSQATMDFSCMAVWWTYCFGFVLTMTALFSKTWRINKIMKQKAFRRIQVKTRDVIVPGFIILTTNLSVLAAWSIIAPSRYQRSHKFSYSFDKYGRPEASFGVCISEESAAVGHTFFLSLLFILNGVVVFIANYQIWQAREMATEYSESRYIGLAMIVLLQTLLIGAPVMIFPLGLSKADYIINVLCVFVSSGFVLLLIFLPKLIFHREFEKMQKRHSAERERRLLRTLRNFRAHNRFDSEISNMAAKTKRRAQQNIWNEDDSTTTSSEKKGVKILFRSEREEQESFVKLLKKTQSTRERLKQESTCLKRELILEKENFEATYGNSSA